MHIGEIGHPRIVEDRHAISRRRHAPYIGSTNMGCKKTAAPGEREIDHAVILGIDQRPCPVGALPEKSHHILGHGTALIHEALKIVRHNVAYPRE